MLCDIPFDILPFNKSPTPPPISTAAAFIADPVILILPQLSL
jgi:hypothetical protein